MSAAVHHGIRPLPDSNRLCLYRSPAIGIAICVVGFIVAIPAAPCLGARSEVHPFHVTVAEATMNTESGRLEVALSVFPDDLEEALTRRAKRPIKLEKTENIDDLIVAYLKEVFTVRPTQPKKEPKQLAPPAPNKPKPKIIVGDIHWVGKEVQVKAAWLYFEISLPGGIHRVSFSNQVFFDSQTRQINTMTIKEGTFKTTVRFTPEAPSTIIVISGKP